VCDVYESELSTGMNNILQLKVSLLSLAFVSVFADIIWHNTKA